MRAITTTSDSVFLSPIFLSFSPDELQVDVLQGETSNRIFREAPLLNDFFYSGEIRRIVNNCLVACGPGVSAHSVIDQAVRFGHGSIKVLEGAEPFEFSPLQDADAIGK